MLSLGIFTGCNTIKGVFKKDLSAHFNLLQHEPALLQQADISFLPHPVQRYLQVCGFVGFPRTENARVIWGSSHIKMQPGGKWMKLRTVQYNSVAEPFRIAYMKAHVMGVIPFEGRDLFAIGRGHMLGKVANLLGVFDEDNPQIAQSALTIILAEALLVPGYALSDYISWESIDQRSAAAVIRYGDLESRGTYYFDDNGYLVRFEAPERYYMDAKQGNILKPFTAYVGDYMQQGPLTIPTSLTAAWQLEGGEYQYWKGKITRVEYNVVKD